MQRFMWWHLYRLGHSVSTNRHIQTAPQDGSRGWLHRCSCGEFWAR